MVRFEFQAKGIVDVLRERLFQLGGVFLAGLRQTVPDANELVRLPRVGGLLLAHEGSLRSHRETSNRESKGAGMITRTAGKNKVNGD